jgi:hypothetical protein
VLPHQKSEIYGPRPGIIVNDRQKLTLFGPAPLTQRWMGCVRIFLFKTPLDSEACAGSFEKENALSWVHVVIATRVSF